jgi:hypothetical protein
MYCRSWRKSLKNRWKEIKDYEITRNMTCTEE